MNENENIQFGTWEVLPNGDMIEAITDFYIHAERLSENDWIRQAIALQWNLQDFIPAWYHAIRLTGLTKIELFVDYE